MRKRLLSILVMCVMVLSLVACGSTKSETEKSETEKDTTKDETKDADETSDETSEETVTIELLLHKGEAVDMMQEVVKQFTEEYPNIIVDVVSPADYSTVIQSRFTAEDYPDIWTWANESAWFPYFTGGYCYDLSGEAWMSSLSDANKDWVTFEVEGNEEVIALPYWLNTYGIYYNVDLFEEKGYKIPTTLDDLWALCDQMVADGVTPFSVSDGEAWTVHNIYERLAGLFFQDKGEKFQAIADGSLSATEDAELRMLAETLVKIREYGTEDSLALAVTDACTLLANGEVAMYIGLSSTLPVIQEANLNASIKMFSFPDEVAEDTSVCMNGDLAFSVCKESDHVEEALTFLNWLADPEIAQLIMDEGGAPASCIAGTVISDMTYELQEPYLNDGAIYPIARNYWHDGMKNEVQNLCLALAETSDVDAFLQGIDDAVEMIYVD